MYKNSHHCLSTSLHRSTIKLVFFYFASFLLFNLIANPSAWAAKVGILGDIHCEEHALDKTLAEFKKIGVTDVIITGDIVNYPKTWAYSPITANPKDFPQSELMTTQDCNPLQFLERLNSKLRAQFPNEKNIKMVLGDWEDSSHWGNSSFVNQIEEKAKELFKNVLVAPNATENGEVTIDGKKIRVTHVSPVSTPSNEPGKVIKCSGDSGENSTSKRGNADSLPGDEIDLQIFGDTHRRMACFTNNGVPLINPGALIGSQTHDSSDGKPYFKRTGPASFAVYETDQDQVRFYRVPDTGVPGDIEEITALEKINKKKLCYGPFSTKKEKKADPPPPPPAPEKNYPQVQIMLDLDSTLMLHRYHGPDNRLPEGFKNDDDVRPSILQLIKNLKPLFDQKKVSLVFSSNGGYDDSRAKDAMKILREQLPGVEVEAVDRKWFSIKSVVGSTWHEGKNKHMGKNPHRLAKYLREQKKIGADTEIWAFDDLPQDYFQNQHQNPSNPSTDLPDKVNFQHFQFTEFMRTPEISPQVQNPESNQMRGAKNRAELERKDAMVIERIYQELKQKFPGDAFVQALKVENSPQQKQEKKKKQEKSKLTFDQLQAKIFESEAIEKLEPLETYFKGLDATLLHQKNDKGFNLLSMAVRQNKPDIVKKLITQNVDFNNGADQGHTPLIWAIKNNKLELAKILINQMRPQDLNSKNKWGSTALMWAARTGQDELVKLLLERGADPSMVNDKGSNALIWAAKEKQASAIDNLLEDARVKDTINRKNVWESSALSWSIIKETAKTTFNLLKNGADARTTKDGKTMKQLVSPTGKNSSDDQIMTEMMLENLTDCQSDDWKNKTLETLVSDWKRVKEAMGVK